MDTMTSRAVRTPEHLQWMSGSANCSIRCSTRALVRLLGRGHQHRVDEVDGRVGGVHAAADDVGVVHLQVVARAGDGDVAALDRLVGADDVLRRDLTGDDVVRQDAWSASRRRRPS